MLKASAKVGVAVPDAGKASELGTMSSSNFDRLGPPPNDDATPASILRMPFGRSALMPLPVAPVVATVAPAVFSNSWSRDVDKEPDGKKPLRASLTLGTLRVDVWRVT